MVDVVVVVVDVVLVVVDVVVVVLDVVVVVVEFAVVVEVDDDVVVVPDLVVVVVVLLGRVVVVVVGRATIVVAETVASTVGMVGVVVNDRGIVGSVLDFRRGPAAGARVVVVAEIVLGAFVGVVVGDVVGPNGFASADGTTLVVSGRSARCATVSPTPRAMITARSSVSLKRIVRSSRSSTDSSSGFSLASRCHRVALQRGQRRSLR